MQRLHSRGPAGVIDRHINENPRAVRMDGIRQFLHLLQRRRAPVEHRQRRIHRIEIQRCERTSVATHPRIGRRHREDRRQQHDLEAQLIHDVRQLPLNIAQLSRRRDHRPSGSVSRLQLIVGQQFPGFILLEQPGERSVDAATLPRPGGLHLDGGIALLFRPEQDIGAFDHHQRPRLKNTDFVQW